MKIAYSLLYRVVKSSLRIPNLQKLILSAHMMPQVNNPKPTHVTDWNKEKMKLSSVYGFKVYMKQVLWWDSNHIPGISYYLYANILIVKTVHRMLTLLWTLSLYNQDNGQYGQTKLSCHFLTVDIHKMFSQCVLIFLIYIVLAQICLNKLQSTSHKALFFLTVFLSSLNVILVVNLYHLLSPESCTSCQYVLENAVWEETPAAFCSFILSAVSTGSCFLPQN